MDMVTDYYIKDQMILNDDDYIEYCLGCYIQEPQIDCTDIGRYCKVCQEPVNYLRMKDIKGLLGVKQVGRKGFSMSGDLLEDI